MSVSETTDPGLLALAQDFREALRHSIYLVRRLDADGELSAAQLSTLKMLMDAGTSREGDGGSSAAGVRVGEIARNLGVRVPSATEQIIKLERAGLARREPDPEDSRAVRVRLTEAGVAAVASANERRNAVMAGVLSSLSDDERAALAAALPVIGRINATVQA
ncbi:MarR family winged helix-turn-helix transcriptional regulator [Arthrobacter sp. Leaf69]|uniref:MarR family winged helix-turn-helix transcriptional regulator n=1 Tax=Arthrobacter sp. Leaf69 TaxID=1736232 RepID=UPI0006FD6AB9|nr:MarR family transcriptional regulator [Arthrobacter sp. Leaf69]KQN89573.1 ArsR family transcriptional regulator [Arthrobacter sp. Leaf69]